MKELPSIEELRERYSYDPETGDLTETSTGEAAGWINESGYRYAQVGDRNYLQHRIAWALHYGDWPPKGKKIDHINGIGSDNRISNLRLATHSQNLANSRRSKNNRSGYKGVYFHKGQGKWIAKIQVNRRTIHLGCFLTPEDAHEAYVKAANDMWGAFANAG